jgi:hypothetical protein
VVSAAGSIPVGLAQLTLTGLAPAVLLTQSAAPGVASLTLAGHAPTVWLTQSAAPGVASLVLAGFAPTVSLTQAQTVSPGAADLTITGLAPTLIEGGNLIRAPGCAALELIGYAPAAVVSGAEVQSGGMLASWLRPMRRTEDEKKERARSESTSVQPAVPTPEQEPALREELARVRERKARREARSSNVGDPAALELRVYEALLADQLGELERQRAAIEAANDDAMLLLLMAA